MEEDSCNIRSWRTGEQEGLESKSSIAEEEATVARALDPELGGEP